ncbi:MAG: hypothetical protein ACTS6J_05350, partial [Burkholderiales bacterium]
MSSGDDSSGHLNFKRLIYPAFRCRRATTQSYEKHGEIADYLLDYLLASPGAIVNTALMRLFLVYTHTRVHDKG